MNINLPTWSFAAHITVPAAMILATHMRDKDKSDYESPELDGKIAMRMAVEAIAFGTLVSTAIAFGTPSFHSSCNFIPSRLRDGMVGLLHLFASTIGLACFSLLRPSDDAK